MVSAKHRGTCRPGQIVPPESSDLEGLPRQLSPTILSVLLDDLVEYNGISYRTVPLRTFRGKYIGLYFGSVGDARCEQFLEQLRGFYIVMNHKFECVLVSSDGSDRDYERHTQLTMWPTYPRGDYRPAMLRNHFEIREVPVLVILDPHGVVVTSNAVSKVDDDHAGFPWAEKVIDNTFGDSMQGRLVNLLEHLDLPPSNGVPAMQHQVIGLIFGELWCPDTRELMTRLQFLLQHLRGRVTPEGKRADPSHLAAIYFMHNEEIEKYSCFLNFEVPFQSVHLHDEDQSNTIRHFLGVTEQPMFCLVSPRDGWIVEDGGGWLKRDPTGVCFPWQPRTAGAHVGNMAHIAQSGYVDCLQQLHEDELNVALCKGAVFVALFHNVLKDRKEAIATIRAAALAFTHRVNDRTRQMRHSHVNLAGGLKVQEAKSPLEILRRELSRPSHPNWGKSNLSQPHSRVASRNTSFRRDDHKALDPKATHGKVLWRVLQSAVEKQCSLHGTAPWNNSDRSQTQNSLSFFYSTEEDRTTQVLNKFCCCDVRQLQQHQMWRRAQAQLEAKEMHQRTEMMQQFDQVNADVSETFMMPTASSVAAAVAASAVGGDSSAKVEAELKCSCGNVFMEDAAFCRKCGRSRAEEATLAQARVAKAVMSYMVPTVRPESRATNATGRSSNSAQGDHDFMEELGAQDQDVDEIQVKSAEQEERVKHTTYLPNTSYTEWNEQTETLLGDNHAFNGTGLIIDISKGCYYICGSLTDKETILKFLDAWDRGELDSFEIRMPNDDEIVKDDDADMEREMSIYSQQVSGILPEMGQNVIPGIVIWIPTLQHSESHMGPEHIFRALLNLAFQRCPREDKVNAHRIVGSFADPDDEETAPNKSTYKKLTPWIEKLWIFGLLDTNEARIEQGAGSWEPPSTSFLAELHSYVDDLLKTMSVERRDDDEFMEQEQSISPRGPGQRNATPKKSRRRFRITHTAEDMLIPHTDLFDDGLFELRRHIGTGSHCSKEDGDAYEGIPQSRRLSRTPDEENLSSQFPAIGNYNLCMRTARTRRELHAAMLDEISYHALVQYLPPPLFLLLVGDLPPASTLPWPTVMSVTHLHVLGHVPSMSAYREISPALNEVSWSSWAEGSADDRISPTTARHIAVPWA